MVATAPDELRKLDVAALESLLAEILELPAQPEVEAFFGAARRRVTFVQAEIARREQEQVQSKEWDRWSADMFQRIQSHDETMAAAREQLNHQKSSSRVAMWVSIAAALASIGSAIAAFLVRP
jgi:phosphoserine aminotransferase